MALDLTCLATRKANLRSASSRVARRALGHHLQRHVVDDGVVAVLHQKAAGDRAERQAGARGSGRPPASSRRKILLAPRRSRCASSSASGAMITSVKILTILRAPRRRRAAGSARRCRRRPRPDRSAAPSDRLPSSVGASRDAAGIGVLDDRDRRRPRGIEFGDQFEGRVGVVDVVVATAPCPAPGARWRRRAAARRCQRRSRRLMRDFRHSAWAAPAGRRRPARPARPRRSSRASQLEIAAS